MDTTQLFESLDPDQLESWFEACGIGRQFIEFSGDIKQIPTANRWQILQAMGQAPDSEQDLTNRLVLGVQQRYTGLTPVYLVDNTDVRVQLWVSGAQLSSPCNWQLTLENGELLQGQALPQALELFAACEVPASAATDAPLEQREARLLPLPALPHGYHKLLVSQGENTWSSLLIAAPAQAYQTDKLLAGGRCWGISVQLYTLRGADNCGMGDFADLLHLVKLCSAQGMDFLLLNPLHALDPRYPENASPYSPADRRFLNPLYISLALSPGFTSAAVQECWQDQVFQQQLQAARAADQVLYSEVSKLKYQILELLYRRSTHEFAGDQSLQAELEEFILAGGAALKQHCAYKASLAEPGSVRGEPDFQIYLQWLAERQLAACQRLAAEGDMSIGLVADLAVGSSIDGCEVASNRDRFCMNARIGAPPDNFNPDGQNWGLPPMLPQAMFNDDFQLFRDLLRSNMAQCGALRIDHVLGYYRLWWCPNDGSNATGAYVHYPADILFAILRLESHRHRCLVIGEDLGVVPPEIRQYLDEGGIYSNCVFYFEKYDDWHFRKPEHYKWQALAMQANHDVAPLTAWWNASDLQLRFKLGLIPDAGKLEQELQWRSGERGSLLQWVAELDLLPHSWQSRPLDKLLDDELRMALTRAIARVASALLSVQLDDLVALELPVNIPGTSNEYANWRRKLPVDLDAIFARPFVRQLLQELNETR